MILDTEKDVLKQHFWQFPLPKIPIQETKCEKSQLVAFHEKTLSTECWVDEIQPVVLRRYLLDDQKNSIVFGVYVTFGQSGFWFSVWNQKKFNWESIFILMFFHWGTPSSQEKQILQKSCKKYISCKISEFERKSFKILATITYFLQKFCQSCVPCNFCKNLARSCKK